MSAAAPDLNNRVAFLLLGVTWFCWGFSYPSMSVVLRSFDVWSNRTIVMFVSGLLLLAVPLARGKSLRVPRAEWRNLLIASLLNMTIFQCAMTFGVHYFSAGRTAVIVYTMPLWAIVFAWILLGERPGRARIGALCLGLTGLVVLMSQEFPGLRDAPLGASITLIAAMSFGLGTVWMKKCVWSSGPDVLGGWQLIIGAVPVLVAYVWISEPIDLPAVSLESWVALAYLIVIANTVAYFAWFRAVAHFPATVSGLGAMAVPIVGIFASAMLIDEQVGWRELTALALICGAVGINLLAPVDRGGGAGIVSDSK